MRRKIILSSAALIMPWFSTAAPAQEFTWVGPAAGSWSVGSNWSGGNVPTNEAVVRIDGGAGQNSAVTLNVPALLRSLEISAGDSLNINDLQTLTFGPIFPTATISGAGVLNLGSSAGFAQVFGQRSISMSGGGTLNLGTFSFLRANFQASQLDYNVIGAGEISALRYSVGSTGFLQARPSAGSSGVFATLGISASDSVVNDGAMSAASGGSLQIAAPLLLSTGTLHAAAGAVVAFTRDIILRGGTMTSQPGGLIVAQPSSGNNRVTLENITNAADFRSERAQNIIVGSLINSGTITLAAPGATLQIPGAAQISGGGVMRLTGFPLIGSATTTFNQTNHTLAGFTSAEGFSAGTISNGTGGLIDANSAGQRLTLAPVTALLNSGTLQASNGGELLLAGTAATVDNRFGRIVARGAGSRVLMNQPTRIFGGTIETDAAGEVVFDAPAGTFTMDNVINLGRLRLNSGTLAGGAGGLVINNGTITTSGTITLAGTITLLGAGQFNADSRISYNGIINLGNRIGGSGEIEGLDNRADGVVDAAGTRLSLVGTTKNSGLMRASSGGTLLIPTVNNTGGRIESAAGWHVAVTSVSSGTVVALAGGTISGQFGAGVTLLGPGTFASTSTSSNLYSLASGQSISIGQSPVLDGGRFSVTGSASINLAGGPQAITLKDIALNAGAATLNFGPGTINLQGTVVNRVNLRMLGDSNLRSKIMPIGVATLSGGGTIHAAGGTFGGGRLINLDNTIYLDGEFFGLWNGGWENYGELRGRGANSYLNFRPTGSLSINRGTVSAEPGSRLEIAGVGTQSLSPTLDNIGGKITAGANSTIVISNAIVSGGILDGTEGQIHPGAGPGSAPETGEPPARTIYRDVTILGLGVGTAGGKLRTESFVTLPTGARFTVGHPTLDSGQLQPTSSVWTGGGEIRVLPLGSISGGGRMVLDGVTMYGVGDVGRGQSDFTVEANASIIARPFAEFPDDNTLDLHMAGATTNRGRLQVDSNAQMRLSVGTIGSSGTIFGTGSIVIQAGGTLTSEVQVLQSIVINDGALRLPRRPLNVQSVTGEGEIFVSSLGSFNTEFIKQHGASLTDSTRASIRSTVQASRVRELSIGTLSQLSLQSTALIVDYQGASPIGELREWITRGYAGGSWNGTGIVGFVNGVSFRNTGVGYAEATAVNLDGTLFLGELVDPTSVVLRATFLGDADLDGTVNIADFSRLAGNFNLPSTWSQGDFNYDTIADIADFALLAANFNQTVPVTFSRETLPDFAAVPEPAAALAVLLMLGSMNRPRRRAMMAGG